MWAKRMEDRQQRARKRVLECRLESAAQGGATKTAPVWRPGGRQVQRGKGYKERGPMAEAEEALIEWQSLILVSDSNEDQGTQNVGQP